MTASDETTPGRVPGIAGLHHVGFGVPDVEAAVALFTEVLGFTVVSRGGPLHSDTDDHMTRVFGVHPRASARMAFVRRGTLTLELIHWDAPDQRTEPPVNSDIGAAHLALAVTDLPAALARLATVPGVRLFEPQTGGTFAYIRLPWGMLVQLMATPNA